MRRLFVLGILVCIVASIAVAGSALATGGKDSRTSHRVARTLTPERLAKGKPFTEKVQIVQEGEETLALVPVEVGGEELAFIVDTGAAQTQITSKFAEKLGLAKKGKPITVTGIGCKSKAQKVKISGWSIGGHALPAATIDSSTLAIGKGTPLAGLLGSDIWSQFGSLKVDYANETITVG